MRRCARGSTSITVNGHPKVFVVTVNWNGRTWLSNYLSSILDKTGLRDRTQAALFAVRHGLTER